MQSILRKYQFGAEHLPRRCGRLAVLKDRGAKSIRPIVMIFVENIWGASLSEKSEEKKEVPEVSFKYFMVKCSI